MNPREEAVDLLRRCRDRAGAGARRYALWADLVRNPALADNLADFSRSEDSARAQLVEILRRTGCDAERAAPGPGLGERLRTWWTGLRGEAALLAAEIERERATEADLGRLLALLEELRADPEALQRLADLVASVRQRLHVLGEALGVRGRP